MTRRKSIKDICLSYLREYPGRTAGEVGDATRLGYDKVWRRLSELKGDGLVFEAAVREWHGRQQAVLYAYPEGHVPIRVQVDVAEYHSCEREEGSGEVVRVNRHWYLRLSRRDIQINFCPFCGLRFHLIVPASDRGAKQEALALG